MFLCGNVRNGNLYLDRLEAAVLLANNKEEAESNHNETSKQLFDTKFEYMKDTW